MCFGNMEETKQVNSTSTLPGYLQGAVEKNIGLASSFADKPFEAYTGERVAPLTANQQDAFSLIREIAGTPNPYLSDIEGLYKQFANTGASSINAPSILGGGYDVAGGKIGDYMNPYIDAVLAPQLREIDRQRASTLKSLDAQATQDGAFGDARSGIERAIAKRDNDLLRSDTIGKTNAAAFDAASNLRKSDIGTNIDAQKTNASLLETALQRAITGGQAMKDLDKSTVDRTLTTADALAKAGATEQATQQKGLDANFEEFLRRLGWDQEKIKTLTSATSSTPYAKTESKTELAPNNSGYGIAGTLLSAILSDRRLKHEISIVGALYDGTPVYRFKYQGDDTWHIGLMAQDLEETNPDAVKDIDGVKFVDYGAATAKSAQMGETI